MAHKINRSNYREYCQEPELTKDEQHDWHVMARAIRDSLGEVAAEKGTLDDSPLFTYITTQTAAEHAAYRTAEAKCTGDWSDVAEFADACRREKRAELAAWHRWQTQQGH